MGESTPEKDCGSRHDILASLVIDRWNADVAGCQNSKQCFDNFCVSNH